MVFLSALTSILAILGLYKITPLSNFDVVLAKKIMWELFLYNIINLACIKKIIKEKKIYWVNSGMIFFLMDI